MPTTNAAGAPPPYVRLATIADWLGMPEKRLRKQLRKARAMDLVEPEHADFGRYRDKIWTNSPTLKTEWENWNRHYKNLNVAMRSHPPAHIELGEDRLRELWRTGVLTQWLEDFASVVTDLVRCQDPAAVYVRVPTREPSGRLKAISPTLTLVNWAYVENLRAWARDYAGRIRAAEAVMGSWPGQTAIWRRQLRKYLGRNWQAVLNRCEGWTPRER